jgi:hypothetical protein
MKGALVVGLVSLLWASAARGEGLIYIATTPSGAQVAVDGKLTTRKTPVQLLLSGGTHKISVLKPGHNIEHRRVRIQDGKVVRIQLTLTQASRKPTPAKRKRRRGKLVTGSLTLVTDVIGADISLDGKPTGLKTPITVRIPVGRHTLRLAYKGAFVDQTVVIHKGNNAQIKVNLRPQMRRARVKANQPPRAAPRAKTHSSDPTYPARRQVCLKKCKKINFEKVCNDQLAQCKARCPGQVNGKIVNHGYYYSCEGVCKDRRVKCLSAAYIQCKQRCIDNPPY